MARVVTADEVRAKNKDLLLTDDITDTEIESVIDSSQIKIFNAISHIYNLSNITAADCPEEIKIAVLDFSAGQLIIDKYPNFKHFIEIGKEYRTDAKQLIKNIVDGKRRFDDLTSREADQNQMANMVVVDETTANSNFISSFETLHYGL